MHSVHTRACQLCCRVVYPPSLRVIVRVTHGREGVSLDVSAMCMWVLCSVCRGMRVTWRCVVRAGVCLNMGKVKFLSAGVTPDSWPTCHAQRRTHDLYSQTHLHICITIKPELGGGELGTDSAMKRVLQTQRQNVSCSQMRKALPSFPSVSASALLFPASNI